MANSRLVGGPEDGTEVDVVWPFPDEIRRGHDGGVLVYAHAGVSDDNVALWQYAGVDTGTGVEAPAPGPEGQPEG